MSTSWEIPENLSANAKYFHYIVFSGKKGTAQQILTLHLAENIQELVSQMPPRIAAHNVIYRPMVDVKYPRNFALIQFTVSVQSSDLDNIGLG